MISLAKKYGVPAVEDASAAALELHVYQYRFVRRYLERKPPVTLRQVDPLIRELTQYRDLINLKIQEQEKSSTSSNSSGLCDNFASAALPKSWKHVCTKPRPKPWRPSI